MRIFAKRNKHEQAAADQFAAALEQAMAAPDETPAQPDVAFARDLDHTFSTIEPSYFYQYSAKARFLDAVAARSQPQPRRSVLAMAPRLASMAGASVVAAAVGVLAFGFITADDSLPGDWNYTFKTSMERAQVFFARDEEQKDNLYVSIARERLEEGERLRQAGKLSEKDLDDLQRDLAHIIGELKDRNRVEQVLRTADEFSVIVAGDPLLSPELQAAGEQLVSNVTEEADTIGEAGDPSVSEQPSEDPVAEATSGAQDTAPPGSDDGSSAGGSTEVTPAPTEPAAPTPTPTAEVTPEPTETAPPPTETVEPTATPTEGTAQEADSSTATPQAGRDETATPSIEVAATGTETP